MVVRFYAVQAQSVVVVAMRRCLLAMIQWIPFLMFFFSNSCRLEVVRAKIMRIVGKNSSWSALLPNFKKNQKRRSVSSKIRFDPFPHLRGHFGDARTSRMHNSAQITVRPAEPRRYDYRIVQLSVSSTVSLSLWRLVVCNCQLSPTIWRRPTLDQKLSFP